MISSLWPGELSLPAYFGLVARIFRIKALGNGQVPIVAAMAWRILCKGKKTREKNVDNSD
jgi:hypothetical protein